MSFGASKSSGQQNSGLLQGDKAGISTYAAGLAPQIGNSAMSYLNQPLPSFNPGKYGVDSTFDPAIETLGNNMFNQASSTAGARGFLSPENLGGVIGSAVQQAAPQLAQYADSAAQRRLFGPDQIMAQRYGNANNLLTSLSQLLGGNGSQSSSSFQFGSGGAGGAAVEAAVA